MLVRAIERLHQVKLVKRKLLRRKKSTSKKKSTSTKKKSTKKSTTKKKSTKKKSTKKSTKKTSTKSKATKALESKKSGLEKKKDAISKKLEKAQKELSETQSKLNEYYNLQFSEIPEAQQQWEEYANAIAEAKAEIIRCELEAKTFFKTIKMEMKDAMISRNETWADTFMLKADLSSWSKAVGYIKEANKLLEKNQKHQQSKLETAQDRANDNKAFLKKQGFKFDKNGYVTGAEKTLEKIKKSKSTQEYEAIKESFDQYIEDMYENIPKAENEWWQLEQEIKENERQIKETTKAMNDLVNSAKVDKLTRQFDVLSNSLDILDLKMERAYGANKIDYMQQQLDILTSMKNKNQEIINQNTELLNDSKKQLAQYGITFDEDGNIDNLSSALKKLDNLQDMEDLQDLVDEYNDYKDSIDDASKSIEEETNKQLELKDSMMEIREEMRKLRDDAWVKTYENGLKVIQNRIDTIDSLLDLEDENQFGLLNQKIEEYKNLTKATEDSLAYQKHRKITMQKTLIDYGFTINDDGTIDGTANKLEQLKNTLSETEFGIVSDTLEDYFDTALDTIPELERELINYQKDLKDIQNTKLEKTKTIEEKNYRNI